MSYKLVYRNSIKKELRKLQHADRIIIIDKILRLKKEPNPDGSAKLKGSIDLYRIRHGNYRVVYQIKNNVLTIVIITVGHRKDIYRKLSYSRRSTSSTLRPKSSMYFVNSLTVKFLGRSV